MTKLWLWISLCFICFQGADGQGYHHSQECVFNSPDLKDIQYIWSMNFNNEEYLRFDSSVGRWVGYIEYGVKQAEDLNKNPSFMADLRARPEKYCKPNAKKAYSNVLDKTVIPVVPLVRLDTQTPPGAGKRTQTLTCSSYNFYPKRILVTWLRDGEEITSEVTSTDLLGGGDWYYQYHSYLEYTPRSGEKISCMVEHPSLDYPIIKDLESDDSMPEPVKIKLAMGATCLVVGLVVFLSGITYYLVKKRVLVPTNNVL